jgi:septum formation protein
VPVPLILASASPRRREILTRLGVEFEARAAEVEELREGEPQAVALENARAKARAVAAAAPDGARVLGADTIVAAGGRILPKPADEQQAREWLELLSDREHAVVSALCLLVGSQERSTATTTSVRFRALTDAEIDWYVAGGEWRDRAGGYAIQGRGAALVAGIEGDYWGVVGLPVAALVELLGPELLTGAGHPGSRP